MGGNLEIESEVGKGSTFTALIPIKAKVENGLNTQNTNQKEGDMFNSMAKELKEKRV